jgi:flagellar biosynthesis protein FlhF
MRDALERVKRELGPDAVILGTRTVSGAGLRGQRVEITASPPGLVSPAPRATPAPPGPVASRSAPHGPGSMPGPLYPHYVELVQQEVAEDLAAQIVQHAAARSAGASDPAAIRTAIRAYIASLLPGAPDPTGETLPRRLAFVGPSGGGKTTCVAKLAARFKLRTGLRVALLSLDMQRLAAHEQLTHYAELLEVPLYTAQTIGTVREVMKQINNVDLLLVDTMGVGLREQGRFARLAALLRAVRPDETHLVLPASLTARVLARVAHGFAPLQPSRLLLTRLDDAIGFGVILNVMQQLNMLVSYVTTGQNVPNDIEEACGERVAELVLSPGG